MKLGKTSTLEQVALAAGATLHRHGIDAVLTGGACAAIYSHGAYSSTDVDFVIRGTTTQAAVDQALRELDFTRKGTRYVHLRTSFSIEFLTGPLAVGGDHSIRPVKLRGPDGTILSLSATDSCRDRLAAFYHWADRQSLAAALDIARVNRADLPAIRKWSIKEGYAEKFHEFVSALKHSKSERAGLRRQRRQPRRRLSR